MKPEIFAYRMYERSISNGCHTGGESFDNRAISLEKTKSIKSKAKTGEKNQLCSYCSSQAHKFYNKKEDRYCNYILEEYVYCSKCGWFSYEEADYDEKHDEGSRATGEATLLEFGLNSDDLYFHELGQYLKTNYHRISCLSPRKFELLVADMFREDGYQVEVTKQTRDGGKDLILMDRQGKKSIVEVKRYNSKVSVDIIRQLRGVQLGHGYNKAILVTSSHYTRDARKEAQLKKPVTYGFDMELKDADDVLKMLDVYANHESIFQFSR